MLTADVVMRPVDGALELREVALDAVAGHRPSYVLVTTVIDPLVPPPNFLPTSR